MEYRQFLTVSIGWAVYAAIFAMRRPLSLVKGDLDFDKEYSTLQLGLLDFSFHLPLFLGQVFFERYFPFRLHNLKKCLFYGTLIACFPVTATFVIFSLFSVFSEPIEYMVTLAILGTFQAFSWSALSRIMGLHLPTESSNSIFGIIATASLGGSVAATIFVVYIQYTMGWLFAYLSLGVFNIILAIIAYAVMTVPTQDPTSSVSKPAFVLPSKTVALELCRNVKVLLVALAIFVVRFIRYALHMWVPYFLLDEAVHSQLAVGVITLAFDLGAFLGTALINTIAEKLFSRRTVFCALVCNFWTALAVTFFYAYSYSIGTSWMWLFVAGFVNSGADSLLSGPVSYEVGEHAGLPSALLSFFNAIGALGAIVEGPVFSLFCIWGGWSSAFAYTVALSLVVSTLPLLFYPNVFQTTSTSLWQ